MKPLQLTIEGFQSFKKSVQIDFSLMEVFSVTGDNGAGKSSILEAILYALFGRTPRMMGKEKSHLISLERDKAAVQLQFSVRQKKYQITRSFKKKGPPFEKLEILRKGNWNTLAEGSGLVDEQIEKILRMPYEAFTKAVLIPQNQFDAFLKPESWKERRAMIMELFDLNIYELMRKRASDIAREAQTEIDRIESRLQEGRSQEATPEKLKEMKTEAKTLKEKRKVLEKEREEIGALQDRIRKVIELKKEFELAGEEESALSRELKELERRRKQCEEDHQKALGREKKEIPVLEKEKAELSQASEKLEAFSENQTELSNVTTALKDIDESLDEIGKSVSSKEKEKKASLTELKNLEQEQRDLGFDEERHGLLQSLVEEAAAIASDRRALAGVKSAIETSEVERKDLEKKCASAAALLEKEHVFKKEAEEEFRAAQRDQEVVDLRTHLVEGEDCPVCENRIETLPAVSKVLLDKTKARMEETQSRLVEIEKRLSDLQVENGKLSGTLAGCERSLAQARKEAAGLESNIERANRALARRLGIKEDSPADQHFQTEMKSSRELQPKNQRLAKACAERRKNLVTLETDLLHLHSDRKVKTVERQREDKERNRIQNEIARIKESLADHLKPGVGVEKLLRTFEDRLSKASKEIDELRQTTRVADRSLTEARTDEKNTSGQLAQRRKKLEVLLPKMQSLTAKEQKYSKDDLENAEERLGSLNREVSEMAKSMGVLEAEAAQMEQLIKELAELRKKATKSKELLSVYGALSRDLQSDKLQEYVVQILLEQLIQSANLSLQELTQNRYSLHLQEKRLLVHDSWSSEQSRNVQTLSGGETFVVSLALAFSLSNFVRGGATLESLFLDEGFGSLHKDKLDLVYDALGRLSTEGKMLGVVTHLEELAARFPVRIHVKNTPSGSEVEIHRRHAEFTTGVATS